MTLSLIFVLIFGSSRFRDIFIALLILRKKLCVAAAEYKARMRIALHINLTECIAVYQLLFDYTISYHFLLRLQIFGTRANGIDHFDFQGFGLYEWPSVDLLTAFRVSVRHLLFSSICLTISFVRLNRMFRMFSDLLCPSSSCSLQPPPMRTKPFWMACRPRQNDLIVFLRQFHCPSVSEENSCIA